MEVQTMFWVIAGLIFVSMIILVGVALSGQLLQMQTCSEEDIYFATSRDDTGAYCGLLDFDDEYVRSAFYLAIEHSGYVGDVADYFADDEPYVYCNYAELSRGVRGHYKEKDACIDKTKHLCCRTCYEASGNFDGPVCGQIDALHTYNCHPDDICANDETHRCCRAWGGID